MEQVCVGVDIGGTSVKMGIFTLNGDLLKKWEIPTEPKNDPKALIEKIGKSIKETLKEARLTLTDCVGVGMGVPGPVMPNGFIEYCQTYLQVCLWHLAMMQMWRHLEKHGWEAQSISRIP